MVTLKASRAGITAASVRIESHATDIRNGLGERPPQRYSGLAQTIPGLVP
jgi:hypothetical protein